MLCLISSFNCVFSRLPCLTPLYSLPPVTPSGPRQVKYINLQLMSLPRAYSVFSYRVKWEVDDISLCVGVWLSLPYICLQGQPGLLSDWWQRHILYTHCTHTVHILYTYCTHTVHTLYTYCTHTVHILYTHCTHTVHIMYTYCTHTVHILYTHCTHTVHTLYTYCTHTVYTLYTYCTHTVHILYTYCTHTVHILYTYCTVYITMCRCVAATALHMSTWTTRVIIWLMAASRTVQRLYTHCTHTVQYISLCVGVSLWLPYICLHGQPGSSSDWWQHHALYKDCTHTVHILYSIYHYV